MQPVARLLYEAARDTSEAMLVHSLLEAPRYVFYERNSELRGRVTRLLQKIMSRCSPTVQRVIVFAVWTLVSYRMLVYRDVEDELRTMSRAIDPDTIVHVPWEYLDDVTEHVRRRVDAFNRKRKRDDDAS